MKEYINKYEFTIKMFEKYIYFLKTKIQQNIYISKVAILS